MSGPRLVMPHFSETDAEVMAELTEDGHPWIHEESAAHAHQQCGMPEEQIPTMDYIIMRHDKVDKRY